MRLGIVRWSLSAALAAALLVALPAPAPAQKAAGGKAARVGAATESGHATKAALAVLRAGGTAADAAVTAALVAGVTNPGSSGLGGGGFALVWQARERAATVLDFRESAPAAIDVEAFERRPLPDNERGKVIGVPAECLGLAELHRRFGKLPWRELVAPAERLARTGFAVEPHLAEALAGGSAAKYRRVGSLDRAFWPKGKPALVGKRVTRKELASTLTRLGTEGTRAIFDGPIAQELVEATRAMGGALTRGDLDAYRVRERKPLSITWEGHEILTMPPPSAGGIMLAEVLGSFSLAELKQMGARTPLRIHSVAEVMRGALADRSLYVGDPDFVPIATERLYSRERLAARKALSHPERTRSVQTLVASDHGTHALVVADAAGNVVSLTTTVNGPFGAQVGGESSGIVLNNELEDFASQKAASALGVKYSPNRARPFVRPTSSMTPTIVLRAGEPVLVLGGSGGGRIPSNVIQVLLASLVDGLTPEQAVSEPRFRPLANESTLVLETGFSPADMADLARRGELIPAAEPRGSAAVQLIVRDAQGVRAAADPRKSGAARAE